MWTRRNVKDQHTPIGMRHGLNIDAEADRLKQFFRRIHGIGKCLCSHHGTRRTVGYAKQ